MPTVVENASGFRRFAWESPESAELWDPRLGAARDLPRAVVRRALEHGEAAPAVIAMAPFEVPLLLRDCHAVGFSAMILGPELPDALRGLFAAAGESGSLWCVALPDAVAPAFADAWGAGDHGGAARLLGIPACCIARAVRHASPGELRWDLVAAPAYRFLPLGIAPGGFLPCGPDCQHAASADPAGPLAALDALPSRLSARDGVAELITPVFRLVFTCRCSIGASIEHGDDAIFGSMAGTRSDRINTGGAALGEGRGFCDLGRGSASALDALPARAVMIPDMAANWPALERWTPEWLKSRLAEVAVGPLLVPEPSEPITFERFVEQVFAGSGPDAPPRYMFSLPFAAQAPEMRTDYDVPACFGTALRALPPPLAARYCGEMFLGAEGTATHLHQDILHTGFWMTVIWGRKRWALCAPESDPGKLSRDLDLFDPEVREALAREGIEVLLAEQDAGDTIYVPPRWWHQVENMRPTLAISEMIVDATAGPGLLARIAEIEPELCPYAAAAFREAIRLALGESSPAQEQPSARRTRPRWT